MKNAAYDNSRGSLRKAFTLAELLLVLTLLIVFAALAWPTTAHDDASRVRSAAVRLLSDIEFAQQFSLGNSADPAMLVFDTSGTQYLVARTSEPIHPMKHPVSRREMITCFGDEQLRSLAHVRVDAVTMQDGSTLRFTARGTVDEPAPVSITLKCGSASIVLAIDNVSGTTEISSVE